MQHQKKERVDVLLVERGLADSREKAKRLIMAGLIFADHNELINQASEFLWIVA